MIYITIYNTWWPCVPQYHCGHFKDSPVTCGVWWLPIAVSLGMLHNASLQITLTVPEVVGIENQFTSNLLFMLDPSSKIKSLVTDRRIIIQYLNGTINLSFFYFVNYDSKLSRDVYSKSDIMTTHFHVLFFSK